MKRLLGLAAFLGFLVTVGCASSATTGSGGTTDESAPKGLPEFEKDTNVPKDMSKKKFD